MYQFKGIPLTRFIPAALAFIGVMVLITLPKEDIPEAEGWWEWLKKIHIDKWAHVGIFAILAFFSMRPFRNAQLDVRQKLNWLLIILAGCSFYGFLTELIQIMVPGRSFDILDWVADTLGAVAAYWYCRRLIFRNNAGTPAPLKN